MARVTVNIHPGGSLGFKGPEMLNAVGDGLVPIGEMLLNQQVGERKILGLETQPYLIEDLDQLAVFHEHFRPAIERVAAEYNQRVLYVVPWPRQYVYTKVEAKGVADLAGIKIRTYNRTTTEMFNRIGMTSVQLPWGEVVPSLAAGTIDAVTTSASSGVDGKFWEFLTHMYPTSHVWSSNMVSVNLDAWNALTDGQREAIEAAARMLEPVFWQVSKAEDAAKVEDPERARAGDGPRYRRRCWPTCKPRPSQCWPKRWLSSAMRAKPSSTVSSRTSAASGYGSGVRRLAVSAGSR